MSSPSVRREWSVLRHKAIAHVVALCCALGGCGADAASGDNQNDNELKGAGGGLVAGEGLATGGELASGGTPGDGGADAGVGSSGAGTGGRSPRGDYFNNTCETYHQVDAFDECVRCQISSCERQLATVFEEGTLCPTVSACYDQCSCGSGECYKTCLAQDSELDTCADAVAQLTFCHEQNCIPSCGRPIPTNSARMMP